MSILSNSESEIGAAPPRGAALSLRAAAFGGSPAHIPSGTTSVLQEHWLRAVALGGQGRYSAARAELALVTRSGSRGVWASLAESTRASLLRQLGWHRAAAVHDGRALAAVAGMDAGARGSDRVAEARCDALTGLAADALGRGRLAQARRLLECCSETLAGSRPGCHGLQGKDGLLRQRIRLSWVTAETALASGDFETARVFAARGAADSDTFGSVRHQVKSDLLRAAALTDAADLTPALELAVDVCDRAAVHGLIPLRWAASMLLVGLGAGADAERVRNECATAVERGGGHFTTIRP
ncbi:hypothetical protein [Rhodococcus artemisiae]|uniref:Uncharacterized protein n=1 Tax=Rhodococcus artemisiae TaxID=714159 RepID=A0ABU7L783_9NOCA|nr:hypothetical protein [Rhodococcus artemisiae]MEE2057394.1 hypothetical protein [Rhodococcus artemisiae]